MKMIIKIIISTLAICSSVMAQSNITTTTNKSTATLAASCKMTASDVVFGEYNPAASDYQMSTQEFTILCTRGTSWRLLSDSSSTNRYGTYSVIINGSNLLKYQIQGKDGVWSDDIYESSHNYTGTGIGVGQSMSVGYRLMPNQYVNPGIYKGTQTMVVSF